MPRARLGVVLLVPPPADREVDALRAATGDGTLGRIPPHLTLVPPVNVPLDELDGAVAVLRAAAARTAPFTLTLGPPATFLPDSPTLYLAVGGAIEELRALRDAVFRPPLERPLTWPFVPHVTVADELPGDRLAAATLALEHYRAAITIDRVHLMREGEGRVWSPIADVEFGPPAVIGRGGLPVELTRSERLDPEAAALARREWAVHDVRELGHPDEETPFALTARRDGEVLGVAEGWTGGGVAHLRDLVVAAAHRGEGVGSHLLAAFESLAAERGCTRLSVRTWAGSRAEAFYRARGWTPEVRFSPWRHGRDMVQLRRDLGRG